MTALQANCPACGAPVTFKTGSSVVVVCDYCNSVVARTDRALEDLGKVADVVESGSPLAVGLKGVCRGVAFELTGRAQLGHAAGGMWDEWYAAFADGRWGWLAEAHQRQRDEARARTASCRGGASQLPEVRRASGTSRARSCGARDVPELRLASRHQSGAVAIPEDA
ncbi:MAG: hypothetical protein LC754_12615 [Acidobacteria bacterium]|nr:hypothetical protein [Acidobacteriota bacterium]